MYKVMCLYDGEEYTLHNPLTTNLRVYDDKISTEKNNPGSFDFTLPFDHPYIDKVVGLTSYITVYDDDDLIFAGRPINDGEDIYRARSFECEGELAFLYDSIQPRREIHDMTPLEMFTLFIEEHNSQVAGSGPIDKTFKVGVVTVSDTNDSLYRYTNRETTLDDIQEKLIDKLGGHLNIRHEDDGRYIDWLSDVDTVSGQPIQLGSNLLTYAKDTDYTEIATACIPLGAMLDESEISALTAYVTCADANDGNEVVQLDEAVETYGFICKIIQYENATTAEYLLSAAKKWLTDGQYANMTLTMTAVDLHEIGYDVDPIRVNTQVRVVSKAHGMDRYFEITERTYHLSQPEKDSVTIGSTEKEKSYTTSASSIAKTLTEESNSTSKKIDQLIASAAETASDLLNQATHGYVVLDPNDEPERILIMDTNNVDTAIKIWKWDMNGLGYSSSGINGPWGTAITMTGQIVANYITSGELDASIIKAGIIQDAEGLNYWNMETGELSLSSYATVEYTNEQYDAAVEEAGNDTDEKLASYYTIGQVNSLIETSAGNILFEVSGTYATQEELQDEIEKIDVSASLVLEVATDDAGIPYGRLSANADYVEVSAGQFIINGDNGGQFTFDASGNAKFSGALEAATGTFSGNLNAAGGTFTGTLNGVDGTFSGNLNAAGGTFSGDLNAAGGTFSGELQAATGTFEGELGAAIVKAENIDMTSLTGDEAFINAISTNTVVAGNTEALQKTIIYETIYYTTTSSTTTAPDEDAEWSAECPEKVSGSYIWMKTVYTYMSGATDESEPVCISGNDGSNGSDGSDGTKIQIDSTEITYQVSSSGTEEPTGSWSKTIPTLTQGKYLWTRTKVTYLLISSSSTSNETTTSYAVAYIGTDGADGADGTSVTISSTSVTYQASSDGTTAPTSGTWSSSIPSMSKGEYLWTRTVVTYTITASDGTTSGKTTTSYSVSYLGSDGSDGQMLYATCSTAASTSSKVATLSGASLTSLAAGATVAVTFTYANTSASPRLNVGGTGAKYIHVYGSNLSSSSPYNWVAGSTVQFVYDGTYWTMTENSALYTMAQWCYENDTTYINGGVIGAATITANKLNVTELSAITADLGDVTAGTLKSANYVAGSKGVFIDLTNGTGQFSGTIEAGGGTIGGWTIGSTSIYRAGSSTTCYLSGSGSSSNNFLAVTDSGGSAYFVVYQDGTMYCREITVNGDITIGGNFANSSTQITSNGCLPLSDSGAVLGYTNYRWSAVYSVTGTIQTSDRNEKREIQDIAEPYEDLFMRLQPRTYMWRNFRPEDNHDRVHCGLIAQEVETACAEVGLDSTTFAALCRDDLDAPTVDGRTERYSINYGELHGLEIHMIQKAMKRIEEQQHRIEELEMQMQRMAS